MSVQERTKEWLQLYLEMAGLMQITSCLAWDGVDDAKAIGQVQWNDAWKLAQTIGKAVDGLPLPVPGADPQGFIWLTYRGGEKSLALQVHAGAHVAPYQWETIRYGVTAKRTSHTVRDIIEDLRATFGHSVGLRVASVTSV